MGEQTSAPGACAGSSAIRCRCAATKKNVFRRSNRSGFSSVAEPTMSKSQGPGKYESRATALLLQTSDAPRQADMQPKREHQTWLNTTSGRQRIVNVAAGNTTKSQSERPCTGAVARSTY